MARETVDTPTPHIRAMSLIVTAIFYLFYHFLLNYSEKFFSSITWKILLKYISEFSIFFHNKES